MAINPTGGMSSIPSGMTTPSAPVAQNALPPAGGEGAPPKMGRDGMATGGAGRASSMDLNGGWVDANGRTR